MAYEHHKRTYLDVAAVCESQGISFIPIVGETSGGWGPSAMCTFKALAKATLADEADGHDNTLHNHMQRMCTAVRRANARAVLRRRPVQEHAESSLRSAQMILGSSDPAR